MKQLLIVPILLASGITSGCVVKTSSSGDPASPASNTAATSSPSPAAAPASPAPAPAASAPASAPAKQTPAPASANAGKMDAPAAHPATPAPAPTAKAATPPPNPATKTDTAAAAKKPQPVFSPPPKPKAQPAERKADDANGVPAHMKPGAPLAYWIWRDKDGETWHVRTTAGGPIRRFSGRIWVDGTLTNLKPISVDLGDRLKKEDEGVLVFDFATGSDIDGFDFKIAAGRCVTFHLLIDGKAAPQEVEIGQKEITPGSATFRLCK